VNILHRATLASLAAAAFLASSCNNSYGVFYSIQEETEQSGSEYFKKATTTGAYKLGSGASTTYFASGTKLYARGLDDDDWSVESIGGTSNYRLLAAAGDGITLYASMLDSDGDNRLYSYDGTSWSLIDTSAIPDGSWIDGLFTANNEIFAQAHDKYENEDDEEDDLYSLYYDNAGTLAACDASLQGLNYESSFVGVAYVDGLYWFATRGGINSDTSCGLYSSGSPNGATSSITADGPVSSGDLITSIAALGGDLYVGTYDYDDSEDPYLYYRESDSDSWARDEVGSGGPPSALCYIASPAKMLVGEALVSSSTGGGYYEGSSYGSLKSGEQDDKSYVARSESIYSTTIGDRAVNAFFWDDDNDTLFVCMSPGASSSSYYGLYSTVYDGSSWSGWEAE